MWYLLPYGRILFLTPNPYFSFYSLFSKWNCIVNYQFITMKIPMKTKINPFFFLFKPRKKRFFGRKTINLSVPQSETSSTKMSQIDEYISSSPTYQEVPDFQRVQITGDYASGVSSSWSLTAGKTLCLIVSASYLPPLPFEEGVSSPALCYT